jgi:hypothetical protein
MKTRPAGQKSHDVGHPLPALGLRPWFAFLRRARSFRRFAFAMAARVTRPSPYRELILVGDRWEQVRVSLASTFLQRLAGVHAADAVLLCSRSVHGKGLDAPIRVVHLTDTGTVVGYDTLPVGGTVRSATHWMLEIPITAPLPPVGTHLTVLPSSPP